MLSDPHGSVDGLDTLLGSARHGPADGCAVTRSLLSRPGAARPALQRQTPTKRQDDEEGPGSLSAPHHSSRGISGEAKDP